MGKRKLGKTGGEPHPVSLKSMIPAVSKDEAEKLLLIEDLTRIGCEDLFTHPWNLKNEKLAWEFSQECSNK